MCEALRELMKPELDEMLNEALTKALNEAAQKTNEAINEAINETINEAKIKETKQLITHVENAAKNFSTTIESACQALEIPLKNYQEAKSFIDGLDKK